MHCSEGLYNPSSLNSFQLHTFHENIFIYNPFTHSEKAQNFIQVFYVRSIK